MRADIATVHDQVVFEPRLVDGSSRPLLSLVIPTYNESARLVSTLDSITAYLDGQPYEWEVLVSDDGSKDDTRAIAHQYAERWPQIRVLTGSVNRGKGAAVRRGMLAARGSYVVFSDADLATPIEDVEKLLPVLEQDCDVVIGSRATSDARVVTQQRPLRRLMGRVFRRIVRRAALPSVRDSQCGFKGFRTAAAHHVFGQAQIDSFAFDVEILLLCESLGYCIQEVGVQWADRPGTTVSPFKDAWRMIRDVYRLRRGVRRRLEEGVQSVPGDDDRCVALIELRDEAGTADSALFRTVDNRSLAGDTMVLERRPGAVLIASFARTVRDAREMATELAAQTAARLTTQGRGGAVSDDVQALPLATPITWLRQQRPTSRTEVAHGTLLTALQVQNEVREADIQRFERSRARWSARRRTLHIVILANLLGLVWWLDWLYDFRHAANLFLYSSFAVAETFSVLQVLGYWYTTWHEREPERKRARVPGRVDVFIATYNEPVELVEQTVRAAVSMPYPHRTYLLDDGNRHEMGAMAERLGATWVTRPDNRGAKAGNINHALSVTDGDFFVVFDADHIPHAEFLSRMMPFMDDPRMGFVQAPQYYANRERTFIAGGAMDQQEIFFGPICRGKDGLGAVFCCGTNMLMRRAAVLDVGGFRENSITEDAVTSVDLHEHGWKSRYVPERLAEGLAPEDLGAYISQQRRWARGNLEMLFKAGILRRHMPLKLRLQYIWSSMYYLTGITALLYLALPCLYLLFGVETVGSNAGNFIGHFLPYIFTTIYILNRSADGRLTFRAIQLSYGLFPVFLGATVSALIGKRVGFQVTRKNRSSAAFYHLIIPQIVSITVLVTAIAVGWAHYSGARTITNSCWALLDVIMLSAIVRAAGPQHAAEEDAEQNDLQDPVSHTQLTA